MFRKLKILILMVLFLGTGFVLFAGDEVILGGQVYAQPHRSTPEEFAQRKEFYRELIALRNANRQSDAITLNMKQYREVMERIWGNAYDIYRGAARSIPICGELIPAQYQEPKSRKEKYYNQQAQMHSNFCDYASNFSKYEQLICVYFIHSQEIEELQKPLLELEPETLYTMKNLEGRMEYLRKLLPELTKTGREIIQEGMTNARNFSRVFKEERADIYQAWYQIFCQYQPSDQMNERLDEFEKVIKEEYNQAYKLYDGKVSLLPTTREEFMERELLLSAAKRDAYISERKTWNANFVRYVQNLPKKRSLICEYMRSLVMTRFLIMPIIDLHTDEPYPIENMKKRLFLYEAIMKRMKALEPEMLKIENQQLNQGEK